MRSGQLGREGIAVEGQLTRKRVSLETLPKPTHRRGFSHTGCCSPFVGPSP